MLNRRLEAIQAERDKRAKILRDAERLRDNERIWLRMEHKPLLRLVWSRPDTDPLLPAVHQAQNKKVGNNGHE